MPLLADRVQETTTTSGTGTLTLGGAVTGYRSFNSSFTNGDVVFYTIDDTLGNWEVGFGTVGTGTLTRTTVIVSSNSNNLVNFGAGNKRVFCTAPTRMLLPDQTSNSGKILSTDGTSPSWIANTVGTVTSVSGTGTVSGLSLSGTVTSSGSLTLGGSLDLSSPPAIGGTTAAAGSFTTLTTSGNVTINGGTANGVAYLNASKVLTTGSALTFDGTNLGVGTTPTGRLDVAGSSGTVRVETGGDALTFTKNGANYISAKGGTSGTLVFETGGAVERMRLDSSGNLGLGVTPSAWSGFKVLQINKGGFASFLSGGNIQTGVFSNVYFDGSSYKYIDSQVASYYNQNNGVHQWYTAPSGTAGNAISFTQAMTLTAAGNLGIGVASPTYKVQIKGGGATSQNLLLTWDTNATDAYARIRSQFAEDNTSCATEIRFHQRLMNGDGGYQTFWTANDAGTLLERARITSAGNLLVGKTASGGTTLGAEVRANGEVLSAVSGSTNSQTTYEAYSTGASAFRFYVGMAGTVYATSTTITAISDQRLKENIRDLDDGLSTLLKLKPRKFDWKDGKGKDIKNDRGFIAQEFEGVFPDLIDAWKDEPPAGEEPYKAVRADLIPVLVKAIQELAAEIESLKQRIN